MFNYQLTLNMGITMGIYTDIIYVVVDYYNGIDEPDCYDQLSSFSSLEEAKKYRKKFILNNEDCNYEDIQIMKSQLINLNEEEKKIEEYV